MKKIKLGQVEYINCLPVYHALEEGLLPHKAQLIKGTPAKLNKMFLEGKLDITPISSIEYARNKDKCLILPDLSISADGRVASILLFSKIPVTELDGKKVCLPDSSATSVALLQILLKFYYQVDVEYIVDKPDLAKMMQKADAALLIGDDALIANANTKFLKENGIIVTDLGEVWKKFTGEKMVYAVWVIRKEFIEKNPEEIDNIVRLLLNSRQLGLSMVKELIKKARKGSKLSNKLLADYFDTIKHDFDEDYRRALLTYYDYAYKAGLIPERVKLNIWGETCG